MRGQGHSVGAAWGEGVPACAPGGIGDFNPHKAASSCVEGVGFLQGPAGPTAALGMRVVPWDRRTLTQRPSAASRAWTHPEADLLQARGQPVSGDQRSQLALTMLSRAVIHK